MSRLRPHDTAFTQAARVEAKEPHYPTEMRSGNSQGPIKMWVCGIPGCNSYEYTYSSPHGPPECLGGMKWSFLTSLPFNPKIHLESAR